MSEPQWIVEGGCTNIPGSPLDMRPRRSDEESRAGYTPVGNPRWLRKTSTSGTESGACCVGCFDASADADLGY
jgi:hypothetical protein